VIAHTARVTPLLATGLALFCNLGPIAAAGSSDQACERLVSRINSTDLPSYRAYRRLEAGITDSDKRGWLEAWTEFHPGRGLTVDVVREGGHEYVRNKILRNLLINERDLIAKNLPLRAPLVAANYAFADRGVTDDGLRRVGLTAARKSDGVVNGSLFLDPRDGALVRLEGRLVKSPSFWVRDVDVVWKYARLGGHVLPVEMTSSGRVRMLGRSTFRMVYDYVSIDGRPAGTRLNAGL